MRIAFFVSSLGDTDLAKETITKILKQNPEAIPFVIPLTATAVTRTDDMVSNQKISRIPVEKITNQVDTATKNKISLEELEKIASFVKENDIQQVYVGVPSANNEIPFQIADHLTVPCIIAYEYMFRPDNHTFWDYVDRLVVKGNCEFAVPLSPAKNDILKRNSKAKVYEIGHLSIDRAQVPSTADVVSIRKSLSIGQEDDLLFISGSSQPIEVDSQFLDALLSEIATGKYSHLQLRMGLHPGVKDPDLYLKALLETCKKYPLIKDQFKIIMTTQFEKRLNHPVDSPLIIHSEVAGPDAAQAASRVGGAVCGALPNEAALRGKPSFIADKSTAYLPETWFANNSVAFFTASPKSSHSREELGLEDSAPNLLAKLIRS